MDEAIEEIVRLVRLGREDRTWHQVTTVNLDFLTNAVGDAGVLRVMQRASLSLADGMPILWAAKALGTPLRARVAGVDLVDRLAARSAAGGPSIYFVGAGPGVAEEAARRLIARYPDASVRSSTSMLRFAPGVDTDPAVLAEIRAAQPDVLCVALGNPKQERWIQRYGGDLGVPVLIGIGGTLDLIVGRRQRAPTWMQRAGLEWIARMLQEPARLLPRYTRDAAVCVPRFAGQWWRQRGWRSDRRWRPVAVERAVDGPVTIRAQGSLDLARDPGIRALRLDGVEELRLDLAAVEVADARSVATIVALARAARTSRLDRARPSVRAALGTARVLGLIDRHDEGLRPPPAAP